MGNQPGQTQPTPAPDPSPDISGSPDAAPDALLQQTTADTSGRLDNLAQGQGAITDSREAQENLRQDVEAKIEQKKYEKLKNLIDSQVAELTTIEQKRELARAYKEKDQATIDRITMEVLRRVEEGKEVKSVDQELADLGTRLLEYGEARINRPIREYENNRATGMGKWESGLATTEGGRTIAGAGIGAAAGLIMGKGWGGRPAKAAKYALIAGGLATLVDPKAAETVVGGGVKQFYKHTWQVAEFLVSPGRTFSEAVNNPDDFWQYYQTGKTLEERQDPNFREKHWFEKSPTEMGVKLLFTFLATVWAGLGIKKVIGKAFGKNEKSENYEDSPMLSPRRTKKLKKAIDKETHETKDFTAVITVLSQTSEYNAKLNPTKVRSSYHPIISPAGIKKLKGMKESEKKDFLKNLKDKEVWKKSKPEDIRTAVMEAAKWSDKANKYEQNFAQVNLIKKRLDKKRGGTVTVNLEGEKSLSITNIKPRRKLNTKKYIPRKPSTARFVGEVNGEKATFWVYRVNDGFGLKYKKGLFGKNIKAEDDEIKKGKEHKINTISVT